MEKKLSYLRTAILAFSDICKTLESQNAKIESLEAELYMLRQTSKVNQNEIRLLKTELYKLSKL